MFNTGPKANVNGSKARHSYNTLTPGKFYTPFSPMDRVIRQIIDKETTN